MSKYGNTLNCSVGWKELLEGVKEGWLEEGWDVLCIAIVTIIIATAIIFVVGKILIIIEQSSLINQTNKQTQCGGMYEGLVNPIAVWLMQEFGVGTRNSPSGSNNPWTDVSSLTINYRQASLLNQHLVSRYESMDEERGKRGKASCFFFWPKRFSRVERMCLGCGSRITMMSTESKDSKFIPNSIHSISIQFLLCRGENWSAHPEGCRLQHGWKVMMKMSVFAISSTLRAPFVHPWICGKRLSPDCFRRVWSIKQDNELMTHRNDYRFEDFNPEPSARPSSTLPWHSFSEFATAAGDNCWP